MDLKKPIIKYFNKGVSATADAGTSQRAFVYNIIGFIGYSLSFVLCIAAIFRQEMQLAFITFSFSVVLFNSRFILHSNRFTLGYKFTEYIYIYSLMALMVYLLYTGGVQNTGPLWIYIVPPVALFLGGLIKGSINLCIFIVVISLLLFYPNNEWLATSYSFEFKSRLLTSFLTVSILFSLYEFINRESIKRLREMSQEFEKLAMHDPLSGLLNRRGMQENLQKEFERSLRYKSHLTIMMCDIDHFKVINDRFGHDKGDDVIRNTADILKLAVRKHDSLSRWGGEEYLFLLPETNGEQGLKLAEKLRKKLAQTQFEHEGTTFNVTVSIGVHQIELDETVNQAISKADNNLYKAKDQGRNRCIIS